MTETDLVREDVTRYIEDVCLVSLSEQNIGDSDNLFEAGVLDSYGLIELLLYLEQKFSFKLTEDELSSPELSSVTGICAIVAGKALARSKVI